MYVLYIPRPCVCPIGDRDMSDGNHEGMGITDKQSNRGCFTDSIKLNYKVIA